MIDDETKLILKKIREMLKRPELDMNEVRKIIEPLQDQSLEIPVRRNDTVH